MGRFARVAIESANLTDQQLAIEIATLGTLDGDRVHALLPERRDKESFIKLMHEVESDKTDDEKLAFLRNNLETAGKVVLKVLSAMV